MTSKSPDDLGGADEPDAARRWLRGRGATKQFCRGHLVVGAAPRRRLPWKSGWKWAAAAAVVALLVFRLVFVELVVVRGNTMAPAVLDGDALLVATRGDVRVGRIVLIEFDGRTVLRRIVAGPGARVTSVDGVLAVDEVPMEVRVDGTFAYRDTGEAQRRPRRQQRYIERAGEVQHAILGDHVGAAHPWLLDLPELEVPRGHVFVLCDNRRTCPLDERSGVVPLEWIEGVATHVLWTGDARLEDDHGAGGFSPLTSEGSTPPRK